MIELTLVKLTDFNEGVLLLNNILQWLAVILTTQEENKDIKWEGSLTVYDSVKPRVAAMLMCEGESEKRINELLKNPPGEYKEKYIACRVSEEPPVVMEDPNDDKETKEEEQTDAT